MPSDPLIGYFAEIETEYRKGIATEHSYRHALKTLLEGLTPNTAATNEPKRPNRRDAPDYVVQRRTGNNTFVVGYVEAKDIGANLAAIEKDSNKPQPTSDEGRQLKRYRASLPNLLFTDYLEFRWYVNGEHRKSVRLAQPASDNTLARSDSLEVRDLLERFLQHASQPVSTPRDLAVRMARLAHIIRDEIVASFEEETATDFLWGWRKSLARDLIAELDQPQKTPEFADMFAQTLAYGLFSARVMDTTEGFTRQEAQELIPNTNPFLQSLFHQLSAKHVLEREPYGGYVEDIVTLLANTDMNAVLADFGRRTKQEDPVVHFYETFLAAYDPKLREARGVYYTPEPVVSYIIRSVDWLLRDRFKLDGLADSSTTRMENLDPSVTVKGRNEARKTRDIHRVLVLDPACGTGTFLYALVDHIRRGFMEQGMVGMWSDYVRRHLLPRIFGFELLMASYAVAHFKLGMQLAGRDLPEEERADWAYDFSGNERLNVFLTNTLQEAHEQTSGPLFSEVGRESFLAGEVKRDLPIMVVMGNPPYSNFGMMNRGEWIRDLLDDYKTGLNEKKINLDDDFIKFIRFSQWRIGQSGAGILAFITNNTYIDGITHRRMRQSLRETFNDIYVLDLHGNSKKREQNPAGTKDENVFDIQQSVSISIFVKEPGNRELGKVRHAELWGSRASKYDYLLTNSVETTKWQEIVGIEQDSCLGKFYFYTPTSFENIEEYCNGVSISKVFLTKQNGVKTDRDDLFFDLDHEHLKNRMEIFYSPQGVGEPFASTYRIENSTSYDLLPRRLRTMFSEANIRRCLYRPFDTRWLYYFPGLTSRPAWEVMQHLTTHENLALLSCRQQAETGFHHVLCSRTIAECCAVSLKTREITSAFPLYLYPTEKQTLFDLDTPTDAPGGRRPNLNPDFIAEMERKLGMTFVPDGKGDLSATFGPEDIFNYMYAVFHSPTYRARYAEFLKIDFPRLPLTSNPALFRVLCSLGAQLVPLHLMEQHGPSTAMPAFNVKGTDEVEKVHYTGPGEGAEHGRVHINKTQYFEGIPQHIWDFHIGGYRVSEKWLKDRKGRTLTYEDVIHYRRVIAALSETIRLMSEIDAAIPAWPIE